MCFLAKKELKNLNLADFNILKILFASIITLFTSLVLQSKLEHGNLLLFVLFSIFNFLLFYILLKIMTEKNVNEIQDELQKIFSNVFKGK